MINYIYILAVILLCTGLFMIITDSNYIRRLVGVSIFQTACIIFFVALGKLNVGIIPFDKCQNLQNCPYLYSASLPHVLMLTAIVVGFATLCVGIALIYKINKNND